MNRTWIIAVAVAAVLTMPAVVRAHEGHVHKVLGTVTSVQGNQLEVKSTDGKALTITLDAKTVITRGKTKADVTALKAGERVSVDYLENKNTNTAKTVKLAEVPAAAKK